MAFAQARYGFWLRNMPVDMAGKFSATMTAEALVVFAAALYLGLETKVSWPGAGLFYAGYSGDFGFGIGVFEAGVEGVGYVG